MPKSTKETDNNKFIEKTKRKIKIPSYIKDKDGSTYLENLKNKIIKEMKEFVKSEKGQVKIKIDEENDLCEITLPSSYFEIIFDSKESKIYANKDSKSYIIANQSNIRVLFRKKYVYMKQRNGLTYVVTNRDIKLDETMENIIKEKDVISFYSKEIAGIVSEMDCLKINYTAEANDKALIKTNNTLLISEEEEKVFLPYTADDLKKELMENDDFTVAELIEKKHTVSLNNYKNPMRARFKEAFNLMRYKEKKSFGESVMLGMELMFESNLHPAIISACRNLQELDIYLDCLDDNELEKFSCFKIVYKAMPILTKNSKLQFLGTK